MDPLIALTISLSLAALLAGAAAHKVLAWKQWKGVIDNYRLVPDAAPMLKVLLPCGEVVAAVLLLLPFARPLGAGAAAALLLVYAVAMGVNIARGRTAIDCGCFGSQLRHGISGWMVGRNIMLAILALTLCLPASPRPLSAFDVLLEKDGEPGAYRTLVQSWSRMPGTPTELQCLRWMVCLTEANHASTIPMFVSGNQVYDPQVTMTKHEVSFVDGDGATVRVVFYERE